MRIIRFSLRRLLILTGLVAVVLYVLYLRPVALAKQFTHQIETSTDLKSVSAQYFNERRTDGASVESTLAKRTWSDVFKCRQRFSVRFKGPANAHDNRIFASCRDFYATTIGVQEMRGLYLVEYK